MKKLSIIILYVFTFFLFSVFTDTVSAQTCSGGGYATENVGACYQGYFGNDCSNQTQTGSYFSCGWGAGYCSSIVQNAGLYTYCDEARCDATGEVTFLNRYAPVYSSYYCTTNYPDTDDPPPPPPPPTNAPTPTPRSNIRPLSIAARNSSGSTPDYFKTGEQVYVTTQLRNDGPRTFPSFSSRITAQNNGSKVITLTSGTMTSGAQNTFQSWTGGANSTSFSPRSFQQTVAGAFRVGIRVNENNTVLETNYSDNFIAADYEVRASVKAYICNDRNENGNCGNQQDTALKDRAISLDEDVTSAPGFEDHIKTTLSATNGQVDFDYRKAGHYKISFADQNANLNWLIIGSQNVQGGSGTWDTNEACYTDLGANWTCNLAAVPLHTVSGRIFIDTDRDTVLDANETQGLSGRTVTLTGGDQQTTTTSSNGSYSFTGLRAGHVYKVEVDLPSNYGAFPSDKVNVNPPVNTGEGAPRVYTTNIAVNEAYSVNGRVYVDSDQDGSYNPSKDLALSGVEVDLRGKMDMDTTTDSNGMYTFTGLINSDGSNYAVSTPLTGTDYIALTSPWPRTFLINNASAPQQNLRLYGKHYVEGDIFVDTNGDKIKNGGEVNYVGNPSITVVNASGGNPIANVINNNAAGTYRVENLISRTYSIRYGGLPNGYYMVHPLGSVPPAFSVITGTNCAPSSNAPGGTCTAGDNISDLDFAITAGQSWIQTLGTDIRFDNGINNPVPATPDVACGGAYTNVPGSSTMPGIGFSGNTSASNGQGQMSSTGWLVGNSTYGETYSPKNSAGTETSYAYLQSVVRQIGATPINLATYCNINNCTLPGGLPGGIFQVNGTLNLNTYSFDGNKDYVILVSGALNINGEINVANGSTATFSVANNITIDQEIGRAAACPAPANAQVEGFYSTDDSFIVESKANCATNVPDEQLNMQGSVVVNADLNGGVFQNMRSLCDAGNLLYPSFTIKDRPDLIINTPEFLRVPTYIWQEVAP